MKSQLFKYSLVSKKTFYYGSIDSYLFSSSQLIYRETNRLLRCKRVQNFFYIFRIDYAKLKKLAKKLKITKNKGKRLRV